MFTADRFRSTIRLKLLLSSSSLLLLIFSGMTVYLVHTNTSTLRVRLQTEARAFAALATGPVADTYNIYAGSGTDQIRNAMQNYLQLNKSVTNITIVDLTGSSLFAYDATTPLSVTPGQASSFTPTYVKSGAKLEYIVYPYFSASGGHPFSVAYAISNAQVDAAIKHEVVSLLLFGLLLLMLTSTLTYVLINRIIVKPIRQVSRQAGLISEGNLEQDINVHGDDEIAALGEAVNTMAESLKHSIATLQEVDTVKTEFMAITSHNLRTPLTIINGYLESIDSFDSVEKLKKAIGQIGESVKRLSSFAEDVLIISSIELGEQALRAKVPIGDFMHKIISQASTAAHMKQVAFSGDVLTNDAVYVSEPHLRSAVWNLIDNALKFTPEGGTVRITVQRIAAQISIAVSDTGIGISSDEIPKLFTKFHRATSVIQYDYQGTGIGLYASKIIIEQQGGTIRVMSSEGDGSTFTIVLPALATEPKQTAPDKP